MPKGFKGFQKGYKRTPEQIENHRVLMTGKKQSISSIEKRRLKLIGGKRTEAVKEILSIQKRGILNPQYGKAPWNKGIGTKTSDSVKLKSSLAYKIFRKSCFERDNYACVWCGQKGGKLNADHIKPFALFPELRMALDNVRTLCHECHKKTDSYGWKFYHNYKNN